MKYFILCFIVFLSFSISAQQTRKNAFGLRLGDNNGFVGELSYQRNLFENNIDRIEIGLSVKNTNNFESVKLISTYQWGTKLIGDYDWYVGAGGGVGYFDTNLIYDNFALIAGVLGIQYSEVGLPLLFSLDIRPEYIFNDNYSKNIELDVGIAVRYQF